MNKTLDSRERISARISKELYERLNKAAEISGTTLNSFIVQIATREAEQIIEKYNYKVLSFSNLEDALWFKQQVEGPALSNKNLKEAFKSYTEVLNDPTTNARLRQLNWMSKGEPKEL